MNLKISHVRWSTFLFIAAFCILHQVYVTRAYPNALYMDSLRLLYHWQEWSEGRMSFMEFWGQGSSHRGFINQLLLIANIKLFSLDVLLANRMTGAVMTLFSILLICCMFRNFRNYNLTLGGAVVLWAAGLLSVALVFCWAGFELLTLDLGLPLWVKNLSFLIYFVWHARLLAASVIRIPGLVILALYGVGVVFLIGMGWSYAFVGSVVLTHVVASLAGCLFEGHRPGVTAWLATAGLVAALAGYAVIGGGAGDGVSLQILFEDVPRTIRLALVAIGATWIGGETALQMPRVYEMLPVLGGTSVVIACLGIYFRLRRGLFLGSLVPVYLIGYGAFVALSVSVARGPAGGEAAVVASRYFMDVMFLQLGGIWLLAEQAIRGGNERARMAGMVFAAFSVVLGCGLAEAYRKEWGAAPYRARNFSQMNEYILAGVPNKEAADLLQSPIAHARRGVEVMRSRSLSVFAGMSVQGCSVDRVRHTEGWHAEEAQGRWLSGSGAMGLPACPCPLSISAYIPENFESRIMDINDGVGGEQRIQLLPGQEVEVVVPPSPVPRNMILRVSAVTVPSRDLGNSRDARELGVLWTTMAYSCGQSSE